MYDLIMPGKPATVPQIVLSSSNWGSAPFMEESVLAPRRSVETYVKTAKNHIGAPTLMRKKIKIKQNYFLFDPRQATEGLLWAGLNGIEKPRSEAPETRGNRAHFSET